MTARTDTGSRGDLIARNRWLVHVVLILGFLAAVISAVFLSRKYLGHSGTTDHSIIGLLVFALVLIHLIQRRQTIRRMLSRLFTHQHSTGRQSRQAASDIILWILTLNAMVSGFVDFEVGHTIFLPIPGPNIVQKWHAMSILILLVYVIVHVVRRRKRLRASHIR